MFDSIVNVGDFFSDHWLAEVFPSRLKALTKKWREEHEHGKATPWHGLQQAAAPYLKQHADLADVSESGYVDAVTGLHTRVLQAAGFEAAPTVLHTTRADHEIDVPLVSRHQSAAGEALHVLQARPVDAIDDLFGDDAHILTPIVVHETSEKTTEITQVTDAVRELLLTDDRPRYVLVLAGRWVLLGDVSRWAEGRYLAFDIDTALGRRDTKSTGELAWHAGLWSADVLLPTDEGTVELDEFTDDSVKHAVGVSAELRDGLRVSIELIANEVITQRRAAGLDVDDLDDLPRNLTQQSLRFLYRILFLLYAEARPELRILPTGDPDYAAGYGLDRLRELAQVPLTEASAGGAHLHESLQVLFRLINGGHNHDLPPGHDEPVFEALRADLFDPGRSWLLHTVTLRNQVLQRVLSLLMLAKPSKKSGQAGYVSYAQLGINQLGAVYEGLMAYSGFIADQDLQELAKDGDPSKGTWLVPLEDVGDYDAKHLVRREDPVTGTNENVIHRAGTFVFRLSGRDRQRSASYYTPEVLTRCVVTHALAELITDDMAAADILTLRVCEPALGSGAFLNEAINQLATAYLDRRQRELDMQVQPEAYVEELQRVKSYLALHQCYGVDLNHTAVELAEVSLWLNVMYPGLRAPWFGLHLRRGNSLIGARRATYDLTKLARAKQKWHATPPIDRPLANGAIGDGEIHHFLLPAADWGSVGSTKQAKELAPEHAEHLRSWNKQVKAKPTKEQAARLQALARRVERLWTLTRRRLQISEAEVSRHIDVWGADRCTPTRSTVTREQVEQALLEPDSPYQRLRLVMDAWCALWYWPVTTDVEPPTLDEWIRVCEGLLGKAGKATVDQGFHELPSDFEELGEVDTLEREMSFMDDVTSLVAATPWLGVARDIASSEGFFHWELDFAHVFADGGFDLQVGNPPWVRPLWKDDEALAEHDPFFLLTDHIPVSTFRERREDVLADVEARSAYLTDLASWCGDAEHLGSVVDHPVLAGVQTNLYMNFIERAWRSLSPRGVVGLLHPEGHFTDPDAGKLRATSYSHLRLLAEFLAANRWFEGVDSPTQTFVVAVYGSPGVNSFRYITNLQSVETLNGSIHHDGQGDVPGLTLSDGGRDLRPHRSRVMMVDEGVLSDWIRLFDAPGTPANEARLVRPVTQEQVTVLATLARADRRLVDLQYWWSSGWHEKGAKDNGFIEWRTEVPDSWDEVVLQGPHFSVATPFAKEPNPNCRSKADYSTWDLQALPERVIPRTNYQRACARDRYDAGLAYWDGRPYTDYWRLAWRRMTQPGPERSLHSACIPPGPCHVDAVNTLATEKIRDLVVIGGLWASLSFDYLVKVGGVSKVNGELIRRFPAPLEHPAAPLLLLRTLRLNCLTRDYAALWEELYEPEFAEDGWTSSFQLWDDPTEIGPTWTMDTPFRTDAERRAALVEIDALVALMLGLSVDQLCLMYRAQFPVLRKYEYQMFFDAKGQKICGDHHSAGVNQGKEDYGLVKAYVEAVDDGLEPEVELPEMYQPPFVRPDREAEMRAAYAEFTQRLEG